MEVVLLKQAREDRDYWLKTGNQRIMKRITDLLNDINKHPFFRNRQTGTPKRRKRQME